MRRLPLIALLALASACGSQATPTSPGFSSLPAATAGPSKQRAIVGIWTGHAVIDSCGGCTTGPLPGEFTLTVVGDGTGFAAVVNMNLMVIPIVVPLTGSVTAGGSVGFSGTSDAAPTTSMSVFGSRIEIPLLDIQMPTPDELSGTFRYTMIRPSGASTTIDGHVTATRKTVLFSADGFGGAWKGRHIVRDCSGDCFSGTVGALDAFTVEISQTGPVLSGWFDLPRSFPIAGRVSNSASSMSGEDLVVDCPMSALGSTCTRRLIDLSTTAYRFGQMSGTIRYYEDGWLQRIRYARTVTGELWHVVRQWPSP